MILEIQLQSLIMNKCVPEYMYTDLGTAFSSLPLHWLRLGVFCIIQSRPSCCDKEIYACNIVTGWKFVLLMYPEGHSSLQVAPHLMVIQTVGTFPPASFPQALVSHISNWQKGNKCGEGAHGPVATNITSHILLVRTSHMTTLKYKAS